MRCFIFQFSKHDIYTHIYIVSPLFLVNGQWGEWEVWGDCSVLCGGGNQSRFRLCDDPEPAFGGTNCTDDGSASSETQRCNEFECPGAISNNNEPIICFECSNFQTKLHIQYDMLHFFLSSPRSLGHMGRVERLCRTMWWRRPIKSTNM